MRASTLAYSVSALAMLVVMLVLLIAHMALSTCRALQDADALGGDIEFAGPLVHVVFGSDGPDLRPLVVAIRSALASSKDPRRLRFHCFARGEDAVRRKQRLRVSVPGANVRYHTDGGALRRLQKLLAGSNAALASPFSLAPFFFEDFLPGEAGIERIVVLHPDVVVQGDLLALAALDLRRNASGAVAQCGRPRLGRLVDLKVVQELRLPSAFDPETCDVGDGVVVIDLKEWRRQGISAQIEAWLARGRSSSMWLASGARLPWLLALVERASKASGEGKTAFFDIGGQWSTCDGLGDWETATAACDANASLLHFSGVSKPWLSASPGIAPLCYEPGKVFMAAKTVPCHTLWSRYISEQALVGEADDADPQDAEEATTAAAAEPTPAPLATAGDDDWATVHQQFLELIRTHFKAVAPRAPPPKAQKQKTLKTLADGFWAGQEVRAAIDITLRGQVVVLRGRTGVVQGPSLKQPKERLNILFREREDGRSRTINILPQDIEPT